MRIFKLIGALVLVLAFSAVAVASASAAETLWRWLPGSAKETFTGKSGKLTFQIKGGGSIAFTKSLLLLTDSALKASSELLENEAKLALAVLHIEGCKSFGVACNSEGDAKEVILMHLEIHNCLIKAKEFGLLIKPLPLHIEVPAVKKLLLIRGAFIVKIEAETKLTYKLIVEQKEGKQAIEKCEGGVAQTLEFSEEGEKFVQAALEAKELLITFDMTLDKAGEEMMES